MIIIFQFLFVKNVHGELYLIDEEAKKYLDEFEGVHENLYSVFTIDVIDKKTNQVHQACSYLLDNYKENLLNENTVLFENYSSINKYHSVYQKRSDTPENSKIVYDAVKANSSSYSN